MHGNSADCDAAMRTRREMDVPASIYTYNTLLGESDDGVMMMYEYGDVGLSDKDYDVNNHRYIDIYD